MKQIRYLLHLVLALFFYASLNAQNCASPLNGGSLSAFPDQNCITSYFSLSVTGSSTGAGLSYQWESSLDNANWMIMPGMATEYLTIKQTATTWYRRKTICDGGGTAYSNSIKVITIDFKNCYCTPQSANCSNYNITNVSLGTLNNSSACSIDGYANYASSVNPVNLVQGAFIPISISASNANNARYIYCYIDFNQNGQFDPKEGTMLSIPNGNVYKGNIKVPYHAPLGLTRMRIMYRANLSDPCAYEWNSETEDYAVNITPNTSFETGFTIYVKPSAPGSNNTGLSWTNAITSLRYALQIATPGDTIKVAEGFYYAGTSETDGMILSDSIVVLGGYPATGSPNNADRNSSTHPVILSGYNSVTNSSADYHVFLAKDIRNCTIDGFIIQDGGSINNYSGSHGKGGGMSIENSTSVLIRNCVFRNHSVSMDGTAIYIYNATVGFENCIITRNGNQYFSIIQVENNSNVNFTNLLAVDNRAAIFFQADSSLVTFKNSTLSRNISQYRFINIIRQSQLNITNSISYYNQNYNYGWDRYSYDSSELWQENSNIDLRNSLTQVYNKGANLLVGFSPKFSDTSSVAGPDGFYFTADDGFSLINPCSPAMNAGSNTDAADILKDITGRPRVFSNKVDIGAYEVQQNPAAVPKVIYVNTAALGANDGSSWANAYTDLHKALQMCSDTIKVATGTYTPWKGPNSGFYWLENKRVLLGAFPARGNPVNSDRNYVLYPTIIDGSTNTNEKAITLIKGIHLDSTSYIDGFTISGCGKNQGTEEGAIVYRECNNPIISNCKFSGNLNRLFYGKNNKNPLFFNCTITGNELYGNDGLHLVQLINCEKTTFRNCVFSNNIAPESGMIQLNGTNSVFDSCTMKRNRGTMLFNNYSSPIVTNSSFFNNYRGAISTDVINVFSHPVFANCDFTDSAWEYASPRFGGMLSNYTSNPVFNNCRFSNGRTTDFGGIAYNDSSLAKFTNCVFANSMNPFYNANGSNIEMTNCISYGGSGQNNASFMNNVRSSPVITNCTVVNNNLGYSGVLVNDYGSNPVITNTIFWRNFLNNSYNTAPISQRVEVVNQNNSNPIINNCMFEVYDAGAAGNNTISVDPRLKNFENPIGLDNTWFTADDGFRLCDCSGAINSGDNAALKQTVDITGHSRLFGNIVDRGAYELEQEQSEVSPTSYVHSVANGNNTGADWANAYVNLQSAIQNPCTDTIRIAAGLYKPALNYRDSGFYINRNLVLMGSYDPVTGEQDVDAHPSIISGDIGVANVNTDNSYGLFKAYYLDTLIMNGLVVQDANGPINSSFEFKSGLDANKINLLSVVNCRFNNNITNVQGGALAVSLINKLDIRQTVFSRNKATWGGAVFFNHCSDTPKFYQCIFDANEGSYGGGIYTEQAGAIYSNCLFLGNHAVERGGGMYLVGNPNCLLVNCTFSKNYTFQSYGCGIYTQGTPGGKGPEIVNCIFTDNNPNQSGQNYFQDIYYNNTDRTPRAPGFLELNIHHSATSTVSEFYFNNGMMIDQGEIAYKNKNNPIGPDGKWFTADDGYQLSPCSGGVDKGLNDMVRFSEDLAASPRIVGSNVDMGSYEFYGQPDGAGLLDHPGDSLLANKEFTDSLGWTHYYKDCIYLMSIKKQGQDIGKIGDSTFELKVVTTPDYGRGRATNLTAAAYNITGQPWYVMNRYWNVKPTHEIHDSILVRFPFTPKDYNDVAASNPSVKEPSDMWFFKLTGTTYPFDLSVPASQFSRYQQGAQPSLHTWTYDTLDNNYLANYFVQSFSGGGGGAWYDGALPDLSISLQASEPAIVNGGGALSLSFTELNNGMSRASSHDLWVYLSSDTLLTPGKNGDTLLLIQSLGTLEATASRTLHSGRVQVPCSVVPGNYYLILIADAPGNVVEVNETNNIARLSLEITSPLPVPSIPVITGPAAGAICYGSNTILKANASDCPSCLYSWSNGDTADSITVSSAGTYTVTVANGCGSASAFCTVTVNPLPYLTVSVPSGSLCLGTPVALTANGADNYTWSGSGLSDSTGTSILASPANSGNQAYSVTGTKNGCSATYNFSINILPLPALTISPSNSFICQNGTVTLTASGAMENYTWTPSAGLDKNVGTTVVARPTATTTYAVSGKSNGCAGSASTTVTIAASVTPAVSIINNGCSSNSTSFTAVPVNGGANPQYQWFVNNTSKGTGPTFTLNNATNGAQVYVVMTPGSLCLSTPTATSAVETVNCTTTAIPDVDGLESFNVAPNPSGGRFTISMKLLQIRSVSFTITNGNGKLIYKSIPNKVIGPYHADIDLTGLNQGLYYLQTVIGNQRFIEKLVIIR